MSISCRVVARVKRERPLEAERVRAPQNRGSRSVYFQGNVTDAFRRSEAELACSEISIVTTRTSVFRERRAHTDRDGRGVGCGGLGVQWSQKRALPYITNEAYPRRARNRATLRGAHPRTTAAVAPQNCRRRRKARRLLSLKSTRLDHVSRSSRQRCAQSPDLPGHSRSRACGVPRRTR